MQEKYNVGIYCRLSRDDERTGESVSIENQKIMLSRYVQEQGWNLYAAYRSFMTFFKMTSISLFLWMVSTPSLRAMNRQPIEGKTMSLGERTTAAGSTTTRLRVVGKCALREGRQRERSAQVIPRRSRFGSLLLVDHRLSSLCHFATNEPSANVYLDGETTLYTIHLRITIWAEEKTAFLKSWETIIALRPTLIYPGHGKPWGGAPPGVPSLPSMDRPADATGGLCIGRGCADAPGVWGPSTPNKLRRVYTGALLAATISADN